MELPDLNDPQTRKKALLIAAVGGAGLGLLYFKVLRKPSFQAAPVDVTPGTLEGEPTGEGTTAGGTITEEDLQAFGQGVTAYLEEQLTAVQDALDAMNQEFAAALGGVWDYMMTAGYGYPVEGYDWFTDDTFGGPVDVTRKARARQEAALPEPVTDQSALTRIATALRRFRAVDTASLRTTPPYSAAAETTARHALAEHTVTFQAPTPTIRRADLYTAALRRFRAVEQQMTFRAPPKTPVASRDLYAQQLRRFRAADTSSYAAYSAAETVRRALADRAVPMTPYDTLTGRAVPMTLAPKPAPAAERFKVAKQQDIAHKLREFDVRP